MPPANETLNPDELELLRAAALGKEVAVDGIECELSNLWDADDTATRASLMNFSIYSENIGALLENSGLIAEITREHACRALLIMCLPEKSDPRIRAWITAHCRLGPEGKKEACSEQIAFLVESDSANLIRNIVFSHLDSDLPLVLWWQGEFTDRFEERLYSSIDRLFVDSASATDGKRFYDTITRALECDGSRFLVHDLAWTRSHTFRLAIALAFDDPALLSKLPEAATLTLGCAPGAESAALLLLAWLATQAGWRWDDGAGVFHLNGDDGRTLRFVFEKTACAAPLCLLQIEGNGFSLTVSRDPSAPYLRQTILLGGSESVRMFPAGPDGAAGLVADQLMRGGNNRLFLKIVPTFRKLLASFPA